MSSLNKFKEYEKYGKRELTPIVSRIFRRKIEELKSKLKKDYGIDDKEIFGGLLEIVRVARQKKKTMNILMKLLKDLSQQQFPREVRELVESGDLFFKDALTNHLLQDIIKGEVSKITYQELPSDYLSIEIMPDIIIKPLQALEKKVVIIEEDFIKTGPETERQLRIIQNLVTKYGWNGFHNEIGYEEGACVSDIWAENKDEWIVLSQANNHWYIPNWFDWSISKKSKRTFDF